jgi:hypothetical protein
MYAGGRVAICAWASVVHIAEKVYATVGTMCEQQQKQSSSKDSRAGECGVVAWMKMASPRRVATVPADGNGSASLAQSPGTPKSTMAQASKSSATI